MKSPKSAPELTPRIDQVLTPDGTRTVGRREELHEIDDLVDRLRSGTPGVLVLRGEAGIGKSHLCRVAVSRATAAGIRTAVATADELEQDRPGRLLLAAEASLTSDHLNAVVPSEAHPVDGNPGYRTAELFVTGMEQATVAGPVLLVAEDLHWADDLSLRGLAMLVRGVGQVPCGVIVTMRKHPRPPRVADLEAAIDGVRGRVHGRVVDLTGLAPAAIEELASQWLRATPGPTLRSMLTRAAGNPFMVEELIRAADRDKSILVADGVAEVAADAEPSTLYDALVRLLRTLSPPTIDALRHASLLGRHFTATELAAVTGRLVIDVVRVLDEAADAGMVVTGDEHYVFRHDLVRDAVYRSILPAARWDLHRAAGAALAAAGAPALRVAQQFAAGARPGDLEAVEWLCRAANDALAVDTASAADFLERALSLAPGDWAGRFDLEADLVELLAWAGRVDDATRRGQALVDRAVSAEDRFRAHQALGSVRTSFGDLRGAAEQFRAAADTATDEPAADQLRCAAAGMSVIAGAESPEDARAVATPHLTSERADVVCWARNTLAVAAVCEGAYDELIEHARVAVSILDDQYVRPLGFLIPHAWEVSGLQYLDRYDESREAAERTRRRAERRGDAGLLIPVMACTCGITWAQADWDSTMAEIDAAFALMEDTGVVVQTILFHSVAALIAIERGRPDDAARHVEAAEAFIASGTLHLFGIDILAAVQARQLNARQEIEAACDLLTAVWGATAPLRGLIQWRLIGPQLVGLSVATGRVAQTATVVDELRALAARSPAVSAAATAMRAEGLANRDAGLLVQAADALLATPRRIEAADAAEDAVHALVASGGPSNDVERLLDAAEEAYVRADAVAALERVQALRREAGLTVRVVGAPPARFGWHSLTPKEVDIVRLVSRGMSNSDIAAELFISRRTVEAHLSHVFQKLEVSNRTQLAREAIDRDVA